MRSSYLACVTSTRAAVVRAVPLDKDRVLLTRKPGRDRLLEVGLSGWIEDGETSWQAAVRETREEIGAQVIRLQDIGEYYVAERDLLIACFIVILSGPIIHLNRNELHTARWVRPADAFALHQVDPQHRAILEALRRRPRQR